MSKNPYLDALFEVSDAVQAKADAAALRELIARNRSYSRPPRRVEVPASAVDDGEVDDGELLRELIRANRQQPVPGERLPKRERVPAVKKAAAPAKAKPVPPPRTSPSKTPGQSVYASTEAPVFGEASPMDTGSAHNLLLAAQVIALANRLAARIWHSGNDHSRMWQCQHRQCPFRLASATTAWRYKAVQVVLEWRRVAMSPALKPSQRMFGGDVCQQVMMLQNGVPLTEYAGNLPQLLENLDRIAEAIGLPTGHLTQHIRRQVISVAKAAAVAPQLPPQLTVPMVKVIRLLISQEGMSLDIQSISNLTGGQAGEKLMWCMHQDGWADATYRNLAWRFSASSQVGKMLPLRLWRDYTAEHVVAAVNARRAVKWRT